MEQLQEGTLDAQESAWKEPYRTRKESKYQAQYDVNLKAGALDPQFKDTAMNHRLNAEEKKNAYAAYNVDISRGPLTHLDRPDLRNDFSNIPTCEAARYNKGSKIMRNLTR